jgi:hypothetical protein
MGAKGSPAGNGKRFSRRECERHYQRAVDALIAMFRQKNWPVPDRSELPLCNTQEWLAKARDRSGLAMTPLQDSLMAEAHREVPDAARGPEWGRRTGEW